ncbi:signal peptidase I [Streptomyces sp. NRRL S-237]|uniref:signal peptidase I n=1 Tax=Streptomyces sp. NRRL S-237 TaxID=1463895 RepID=UPI000B15FE1C|nr:signal peptidase I [Streptomyces sp. NRRL S-237]
MRRVRPGRRLWITGLVLVPLGVLLSAGTWWLGDAAFGGHTAGSDAMRPTYEQGDVVFTKKIDGTDVHRGDAVFSYLPGRYTDTDLVLQRVIGVGGDRVSCDGHQVLVNGKPLREAYVAGGDPVGDGKSYDVTVPEGRLFVMGDNRVTSRDSRHFLADGQSGTIPADAVRERAFDGAGLALTMVGIMIGGFVLALIGLGCGLAGWLIMRRAPRTQPTPAAPSAFRSP